MQQLHLKYKHVEEIMVAHLFCGEKRKTDQSSLVSHQSGLYASNIFWMRKHKLCEEGIHQST